MSDNLLGQPNDTTDGTKNEAKSDFARLYLKEHTATDV